MAVTHLEPEIAKRITICARLRDLHAFTTVFLLVNWILHIMLITFCAGSHTHYCILYDSLGWSSLPKEKTHILLFTAKAMLDKLITPAFYPSIYSNKSSTSIH